MNVNWAIFDLILSVLSFANQLNLEILKDDKIIIKTWYDKTVCAFDKQD